MSPTRRRLLQGLLAAGATAVAGCSDDAEAEGGIRAVNAIVIYGEGVSSVEYPRDVGVRVTVENGSADRRTGVLEVELRRVDADDESVTTAGPFQQSREITLSRGSTRRVDFQFEGVADRDRADRTWTVSATIR